MLPKKATGRTAECPREDTDSASGDDFQCSAPQMPDYRTDRDDSDDASISSSSEDEQLRTEIGKMFEKLQEDAMQSLLAKRKQFQRILNESFQTLNEKLSHILKDEQKNREVYSEYAQLAQPLFHQWQKEVMESEKEEEKLISVAEQQCHMVLHATRVYEANFEEAKKFSVEFLQNMKVLQEKHKSLLTVAQTEVEKEMEKSKENLMIETQNQDVAAVENGHQSLLSESCEERT